MGAGAACPNPFRRASSPRSPSPSLRSPSPSSARSRAPCSRRSLGPLWGLRALLGPLWPSLDASYSGTPSSKSAMSAASALASSPASCRRLGTLQRRGGVRGLGSEGIGLAGLPPELPLARLPLALGHLIAQGTDPPPLRVIEHDVPLHVQPARRTHPAPRVRSVPQMSHPWAIEDVRRMELREEVRTGVGDRGGRDPYTQQELALAYSQPPQESDSEASAIIFRSSAKGSARFAFR